ncbi:MAG: methionyl-tRNA formyltransferase [Spirochaetaceae bacterium]|nr:MAG: methionyl-tRNA formyltransferase [Spirochaetaceae bacterium]
MRILFAGTPEIGAPTLELLSDRFDVVGVLTAPDRSSGRGRRVSPSPIAEIAEKRGIPTYKPERLDAQARRDVTELRAELLVCVAYGRIFGPRFLGLFPRGGVNLHPSLLPRHRGPAPIPAAILAGDDETGLTVQMLAEKMDVGDIVVQERVPLLGTETTRTLTTLAAERGAPLVARAVAMIENGTAELEPQDESKATYCRLIRKDDGVIDWSRGAVEIDRMVRAYDPWPRARTTFSGVDLTIRAARALPDSNSGAEPGVVTGMDNDSGILVQTGSGLLAVRELQLASRKPLTGNVFLNGTPGFIGSRLGSELRRNE